MQKKNGNSHRLNGINLYILNHSRDINKNHFVRWIFVLIWIFFFLKINSKWSLTINGIRTHKDCTQTSFIEIRNEKKTQNQLKDVATVNDVNDFKWRQIEINFEIYKKKKKFFLNKKEWWQFEKKIQSMINYLCCFRNLNNS